MPEEPAELPPFFTPRAGVAARELTPDPARVQQATDVFEASFGSDETRPWVVVIDEAGSFFLTDLERRAELPAPVRDMVNEQLLGPALRRVHLKELYLFALLAVDSGIDRPGLNDPMALDGTLSGPFPGERPRALEGRLTITRGDLLQGAVEGHATRFFVTGHRLDPRACGATGLMLPASDAAALWAGRGAVLAFPYSPFAAEQGASGNERLLNELLHGVLEQVREELERTRPGDPRGAIQVPLPNRGALAAELRARGFSVEGSEAVKPRPGLLGRLFAERIRLPEQGSTEDYLWLSRSFLQLFEGWPSDRQQALSAQVQLPRVGWEQGRAAGLWPVPWDEAPVRLAGDTLVCEGSSLRSGRRRLFFDVDARYARFHRGHMKVTLDYFDGGKGSLSLEYEGSEQRVLLAEDGVRLVGSDRWKTAVFSLPDAAFAERVYPGADLWLAHEGRGDLRVRRVLVEPLDQPLAPRRSRQAAPTRARARAVRAPDPPTASAAEAFPQLVTRDRVEFGFKPEEWRENWNVRVRFEDGRLRITSTSNDPHLYGPVVNIPGPAQARLRMRSLASGEAEILWTTKLHPAWDTTPARIRAHHDGQWHEYMAYIAELELIDRVRLDPACGTGEIEVESLVFERFAFPAASEPPEPGSRVVYYDRRYEECWVSQPRLVAAALEQHGVALVDADQLRAWMLQRTATGAPGSLCFMVMGRAPYTVMESSRRDSTARRYVEAGGRIAWCGAPPFHHRGYPDGSHNWVNMAPRDSTLGFHPYGPHSPKASEPTPAGEQWGLRQAQLEPNQVVADAGHVTVALAQPDPALCTSWFRNYNPDFPMSGIVYIRGGHFHGERPELVEELYRVGSYGL
jgi:hypothetical protein